MDPRCQICIFMGKTDPSAATHKQQSMILVPMNAPGVRIVRPLTVFGYDDAPHGHAELMFEVTCLTWLLYLMSHGCLCRHVRAHVESMPDAVPMASLAASAW